MELLLVASNFDPNNRISCYRQVPVEPLKSHSVLLQKLGCPADQQVSSHYNQAAKA